MDSLVQRLRGRAAWYRDAHPETVKTPELLDEAADALTASQAELEAVKAVTRECLTVLDAITRPNESESVLHVYANALAAASRARSLLKENTNG